MCDTGENPARVYGEVTRRARKQHICDECGGPIPRGFRYLYIHGIWSDGPDHFKRHLECDALWDFCVHELCGDEGGQVMGGLREEISGYAYRDQVEAEDRECGTDLMGILDAIREGYERASA